jgi:hypothetical protein
MVYHTVVQNTDQTPEGPDTSSWSGWTTAWVSNGGLGKLTYRRERLNYSGFLYRGQRRSNPIRIPRLSPLNLYLHKMNQKLPRKIEVKCSIYCSTEQLRVFRIKSHEKSNQLSTDWTCAHICRRRRLLLWTAGSTCALDALRLFVCDQTVARPIFWTSCKTHFETQTELLAGTIVLPLYCTPSVQKKVPKKKCLWVRIECLLVIPS